jgi:cell division protein FtsX
VQELDLKLREKEDEVIKLLRMDHDKTQEIQNLFEEIEEYKRINANLESDLNQIKEVAYTTIMDKDTTISELQERLDEYQDTDGISNLKAVIVELEEKYRFLEERNEESRLQSISAIEEKDEEIN